MTLTDEPEADDASGLVERAESLGHVDPATATRLGRQAIDAAGGRPDIVARSSYLLARINAEQGDLDAALRLVGDARAAWQAAGAPLNALRTDLGRMQILDDLGRHREAVSVGEQLLVALDSTGERTSEDAELVSWLSAAAAENIGVAYSFTGAYERSLDAYERAERAYRAMGRPAETARPRANRGIELLALGRAREALDVLSGAADMFAEAGDPLWSAKCLGNVAQAQQQLGRLATALHTLERARRVLEPLDAKAEIARIQLAAAGTYLDLGLNAEAADEATAAARVLETAGMRHDLGAARLLLALAHVRANRLDAAQEDADAAVRLFDEVGDRLHHTRAVLVTAELAEARGDRIAAARRCGEAHDAATAGGWPALLAWTTLRRADLADSDEERARHLDDAGRLVDGLHLPLLQHECDVRLARRLRRDGDDARAGVLLRRAVERLEDLGGSLGDHVLRTAFRHDRLSAYDDLVDLLVERGEVDEACRVSNRAKARTLLDLLTDTVGRAEAGSGSGSEAGVDGATAEVRGDLHAVYAALHDATDGERRDVLRRRAAELEARLGTLRLRDLAAGDVPRRSGAAAVPGGFDADALAFHVCGEDVIAFVIAGGRCRARRLAGAATLVVAALRELEAQWSRFGLGPAFVARNAGRLVAAATATLDRLHELLLAPIADLLTDLPDGELTIVPHRHLGNVPWAALIGPSGSLADACAVTVSPTLPSRRELALPAAEGGVVVLAVPDRAAPAAAAEAAAVGAAFSRSRVVVGAGATAAELLGIATPPAVLHLACHGVFNPDNPLFSRLRLADRWVTAAEILDLDLRGTLVTLSACESGRQSVTAEPVGLAWAFLAAGASGVVVSGWLVDDNSAAELMTALHRRLAAGAGPADAVRAASLEIRARRPHPYHWAPFSYVAATR